jgi:hypothetical protein
MKAGGHKGVHLVDKVLFSLTKEKRTIVHDALSKKLSALV